MAQRLAVATGSKIALLERALSRKRGEPPRSGVPSAYIAWTGWQMSDNARGWCAQRQIDKKIENNNAGMSH